MALSHKTLKIPKMFINIFLHTTCGPQTALSPQTTTAGKSLQPAPSVFSPRKTSALSINLGKHSTAVPLQKQRRMRQNEPEVYVMFGRDSVVFVFILWVDYVFMFCFLVICFEGNYLFRGTQGLFSLCLLNKLLLLAANPRQQEAPEAGGSLGPEPQWSAAHSPGSTTWAPRGAGARRFGSAPTAAALRGWSEMWRCGKSLATAGRPDMGTSVWFLGLVDGSDFGDFVWGGGLLGIGSTKRPVRSKSPCLKMFGRLRISTLKGFSQIFFTPTS